MESTQPPVKLAIHGPFELPYTKHMVGRGRHHFAIDDQPESLVRFWTKVVGRHGNGSPLGGKDGCYVFAMRASRGYTPWYVGMTEACLEKEVFQADKLKDYNFVLNTEVGNPVLFLVTAASETKSKIRGAVVHQLETDLIRHAFGKNPRLRNQRKTVDRNAYVINGIGTRGKPSELTRMFTTMMGM